MRRALTLGFLLAAVLACGAASAQEATDASSPLPQIQELLVLDKPPPRRGRAFYTNPIEQRLIDGRWAPPMAGDTEPIGEGLSATWLAGHPRPDGWLVGHALRGGFCYAGVDAPSTGVWLLHARGHSWVTVNGARRAGDVYGTGWMRTPVRLDRGRNHLLFRVGRGRLQVRFLAMRSPVMFGPVDRTLPTFTVGEPIQHWGSIVVINGTGAPIGGDGRQLSARLGKAPPAIAPLPPIPAFSSRKVAFRMVAPARRSSRMTRFVDLQLGSEATGSARDDRIRLKIPVVSGTEVRKVTFRSTIDGSVQYYALRPSSASPGRSRPQALFLSLHGAGVEARGQAAAYSPKSWGHVVAPTNRRPFGFDWEQWGRLDALEVLAHATTVLHPDRSRIYLTGHSMGGHGTWQLGVLFPDRFAAIGPSAGWISFAGYGGRRGVASSPDPVVALLARAASPSQTLTYKQNYAQLGVYILHGIDDDNVPIAQARRMRKELGPFHRDFRWHEEPGVKHWWDTNKREPGADCVDWAPMFDFFARRRRPRVTAVRHVDFITPSPGVSATCHWITIEQQQRCLEPSRVDLRHDPHSARFHGTTSNVARLRIAIGLLPGGRPITVELDGQVFEGLPRHRDTPGDPISTTPLWFERGGTRWTRLALADTTRAAKRPGRYGPFKRTFENRVCFVYGTAGTPDENAWARQRARYDAATFCYRGNASIDVFADTTFDAQADTDRNVVCYGNRTTNRVLDALLGDAPLDVRNGRLRIGDRVLSGDDLAILACYPRAGSDRALVGIIGGTALRAMRATDVVPIFSSGVAYPDCTVFHADIRTRGLAAVAGTGFFGNDWSVERGEWAWRD